MLDAALHAGANVPHRLSDKWDMLAGRVAQDGQQESEQQQASWSEDANDDKDTAYVNYPGNLVWYKSLQQRADALKAQLEAARQEGLIDFADDNLKWKSLRDVDEPADKIPDELPDSMPGKATDESGAYKRMLECERRLKKARKKWQQQVRATDMLREKAEELKAKLQETYVTLSENEQWVDFWLGKTKDCHDELGQARDTHRGKFGEDDADNHDSNNYDYSKDILNQMEADLLSMLQDVNSIEELDRKSGHITKCVGQHVLKIVARRQDDLGNARTATPPPTHVQAPQWPEPEPVFKQKPDAEAARSTKYWTDRPSPQGLSRRYHSSCMGSQRWEERQQCSRY